MRSFWLSLLVVGLVACAAVEIPASPPDMATADCHPAADAGVPQYIVGYGSLMQDESRGRTSPRAGPAHPAEVQGFRRAWIARGNPVGYSTTFLGVARDAGAALNAVVYRVDGDELAATDRREAQYCRHRVPATDLRLLGKEPPDVGGGQAWIYVNAPDATAPPSARYPIVQSYVDIFVAGCLEQEERHALPGFARRCIATTSGWSAHWVNDRVYPRRPFLFQPRAAQIDGLLSRELPDAFSRIRIEGPG